ncbi:MAG: signal peptidase I [Lachnospiraceae bacterium]|nr:signal peptidase I [Lachnospiraceae bacterium]
MEFKIVLNFGFVKDAIICINSNSRDLLAKIEEYYCNYISDNEIQVTDEVCIIESMDMFEVWGNIYRENPKYYKNCTGLKLASDIIEDYIQSKAGLDKGSNNLLLHASGIVYKDTPIVFIGKTHSGKSTAVLKLLHLLPESKFLSDDLIVLDLEKKKNKVVIKPYSMPLHVRQGSLVYNSYFAMEKLAEATFWTHTCSTHINPKVDCSISAVYNISYSKTNKCEELKGMDKISVLLNNVKFYSPLTSRKVALYASRIKVFNLEYHDDEYMMEMIGCSMRSSVNNEMYGALQSYLKQYVKNRHTTQITIQGDSMYPTLVHNQVVQAIVLPIKSICEGDVILYFKSNHFTVHRVIMVGTEGEKIFFKTKGDANPDPDNYMVYPDEYIGKIIC